VRHAIWVQNISCHLCQITDYKGRASKERIESASEPKKKSFGGEEFSVVQQIQYEYLSNGFYNGSISPHLQRDDCRLSPVANNVASEICWT
jgi:hypothetical protein